MQIKDEGDYKDRSLYYLSKLYSGQLKSGEVYGDRIIAKGSIAYKPILDNIVNSNRSIKCDTGSTIGRDKMNKRYGWF